MKLVLVGGGGHAGVVADVARAAGFEIVGVLGPEHTIPPPGLERLGDDDWIESATNDIGYHIAIGPRPGSDRRQRLFDLLSRAGRRLPVLLSSSAQLSPSATVGVGTLLSHGAIVNCRTTIGANCIINTRALVEHDCRIGDHVHISPGAILTGGVIVAEACQIGAGSVLLPGVALAPAVVVGAGAVVVRSIDEPGGVWSGNPARRHD